MRILIIDDPASCNEINLVLSKEGYTVSTAFTINHGLKLLSSIKPDLVMLNVMLSNEDGQEICKQIRTSSNVPLLATCAPKKSNGNILHAMAGGADSFLAKPVDYDLLKAHITALLRRSTQVDQHNYYPAYIDAYIVVDMNRQEVHIRGSLVHLSPIEYQLLEILVRNYGHVVPSIEIVEELWPDKNVDDRLSHLYVYINRLRKIIEPDYREPKYIVIEHGLGYRFHHSHETNV